MGLVAAASPPAHLGARPVALVCICDVGLCEESCSSGVGGLGGWILRHELPKPNRRTQVPRLARCSVWLPCPAGQTHHRPRPSEPRESPGLGALLSQLTGVGVPVSLATLCAGTLDTTLSRRGTPVFQSQPDPRGLDPRFPSCNSGSGSINSSTRDLVRVVCHPGLGKQPCPVTYYILCSTYCTQDTVQDSFSTTVSEFLSTEITM